MKDKKTFIWYLNIILCKIMYILTLIVIIGCIPILSHFLNLEIFPILFLSITGITFFSWSIIELIRTNCPKNKYNIFTINYDWTINVPDKNDKLKK